MVEVVICITLLAMIMAIMISFLSMSTRTTLENRASARYQNDIDNFLYNLLIESKSANSMEASEDKLSLTINFDENTVIYRFDPNTKTISRNGREIVRSRYGTVYYGLDCKFVPVEGDSERITLNINLGNRNVIQYPIRICHVQDTYVGEDKP